MESKTIRILTITLIFFIASYYSIAGTQHDPIQITALEPNLYGSGFSKALIYVKTANEDGKIRRPLIVFEGYDPAGYNISIYSGRSRFDDFLDKVSNDTLSELKATSPLLQMLKDTSQHYDLIYVDWINAIDYLQNNERVAETVINWVNDNKVSPSGIKQPNIIVGRGIGSIIADMALKRMEDARLKDNSKPLHNSLPVIFDDVE